MINSISEINLKSMVRSSKSQRWEIRTILEGLAGEDLTLKDKPDWSEKVSHRNNYLEENFQAEGKKECGDPETESMTSTWAMHVHLVTYIFAHICEHISSLFSYIRTFDSDIMRVILNCEILGVFLILIQLRETLTNLDERAEVPALLWNKGFHFPTETEGRRTQWTGQVE